MGKYIIGFIAGVVVCFSILIPLLLDQNRSKFELGLYHGEITGLTKSVRLIANEFGEKSEGSDYKVLYSVKSSAVVVVTDQGVKTIRVLP